MEQRSHILRRFVLLGGETYYARGGFQDFHSSHDTLEDAIASARVAENSPKYLDQIEWWQVWDCETNAVVAVSDGSAYGASDPWPKLDGPPANWP
jgi:hypothetical protein